MTEGAAAELCVAIFKRRLVLVEHHVEGAAATPTDVARHGDSVCVVKKCDNHVANVAGHFVPKRGTVAFRVLATTLLSGTIVMGVDDRKQRSALPGDQRADTNLGAEFGSRTRTPVSHSTHGQTPCLISECWQVGCVQLSQPDPLIIPGNGGLL